MTTYLITKRLGLGGENEEIEKWKKMSSGQKTEA